MGRTRPKRKAVEQINSMAFATEEDGKMDTQDRLIKRSFIVANAHQLKDTEINLIYKFMKVTLETEKKPVADVLCNAVLSDVLKLLKKDFALSQRMIDDMKAKDDKEMVDNFEIKRGHTRDLIEQVKALGR